MWSKDKQGGLVTWSQCEKYSISVLVLSWDSCPAGRDSSSSACPCAVDTDKLDGKHSTAHYWRDKSNCAIASKIMKAKGLLSICIKPLILYIRNNYGAHSWLQPSESSSASAIESSALTQALGDALFWALGAGASGWKASAYLSRAFSQFFWDFDLLADMLSTDRVAPDPRPDWDVLIFSSICRENDGECQDRVFSTSETVGTNKPSHRVFHSRSLFTQPLAFLPAHFFQHFSSFIDLADLPLRHFPHEIQWQHILTAAVLHHLQTTVITHEQKQVHHLVGTLPRCPLSDGETPLGSCIWDFLGFWSPRIHCSVCRKVNIR